MAMSDCQISIAFDLIREHEQIEGENMGYNHGKALIAFKKEWEQKQKQYKELGMLEEKIEKIYDYDYTVFCSDRCFYEHCVDIHNEERNERLSVDEDLLRYDIENWTELLDENLYKKLKDFRRYNSGFFIYEANGMDVSNNMISYNSGYILKFML